MYGKKILSLITTLFVASSRVLADNALTTSCTKVTDQVSACTSGYYCINASEEIYLQGDNCNSVQLGEGVHVFQVNTAASDVVELTLGSGTVADEAKAKLSAYICDSNRKCTQTAGYALFNSVYYKITATESDKVGTVTDISGTACSTGNHGELIATDELDGSGNPGTDSTNDTVYVCLSDDKQTKFEDGNYLLEAAGTSGSYTVGTGSPFTLADANTPNLVVKAYTNFMVFDPIFKTEIVNNSEPYCVNENNKLEDRLANRCNSENCDKYYTCTGGTCTESTLNTDRSSGSQTSGGTVACDLNSPTLENCGEGSYYISTTSETNLKSAAGEGDLYLCSTSGTTFACSKQTGTDVPIGFIKNSDASATAIPYIACGSNHACEAIAVDQTTCSGTTNDGKLIQDTENGNALTLCLDGSVKIALAGTTGSYFVNGQTGSIFYGTSNKYVIVDVDDEEVLLQSKDTTVATNDVRYKYVGSSNYKITSRSDAKTLSSGICTTGMSEFVKDEGATNTDAYVYDKGTTTYPSA